MLLSGILPPVTTPFYRDGEVYYKKLEHNVERYSRSPVAGMVVLGSEGEPLMFGDDERRSVLKCALESAAPEKVMIAGTGAESAIETLRLTEYAAALGYDVAIVRTPHYYSRQMQPLNMLGFFRFVADRSPLPVVIYNAPHTTGYDIPAEVVVELAEHPNVIGIKESSGSPDKLRTMAGGTRHIHRIRNRHRALRAGDRTNVESGAAGSTESLHWFRPKLGRHQQSESQAFVGGRAGHWQVENAAEGCGLSDHDRQRTTTARVVAGGCERRQLALRRRRSRRLF